LNNSDTSSGKLRCRICDNKRGNSRYRVREMMFGTREEFDYFQCAVCGCLQIEAFPVEMSRYYPEAYYSLTPGTVAKLAHYFRDEYAFTGKGLLGRLVFELFPNDALKYVSRLDVPPTARILDVGCGSGSVVDCLTRHGYDNVTGIDPFINADRMLRSDALLKKASIEYLEGQWDFIMFNHSMEHMQDPLLAFQSAKRLLGDDGLCIVRIPTVSSYAWEHYSTDWVQLDAPRHFFIFSVHSIELLSAKAGMRVVEITNDSIPLQLWGSEQYQRDISLFSKQSLMTNPLARTFSRAEKKMFKRRTCELNEAGQGDQIAVVLER